MWEQIRSNRRRSLFVVAAMGVLLVAIGVALGSAFSGDASGGLPGGAVAFGIWLVMWIVAMRRGDDIMLGMARAREIEKADHPVLFNVVEEMSIAAQLGRVPRVYVVDDPSPNAFAAGRDPEKACVAVTTGLLRILDRDELQGVVAHELGHVKNRDVALITTAGVMMGSIVMLAELGWRVLRVSGRRRLPRSSNREGNGGQAVLMIAALALIVLSPILAQLLYFALSRRREYLADASGALFSRYPEGLARALEKLGGASEPLSDKSKVTAPMYIVAPLRAARGIRAGLLATHPPLDERVRVLRAMSGSADFRAYDEAYRGVAGRSIVGLHSLEESSRVEVRPPVAGGPTPLATHRRTREASDAYLSASGYVRRVCTQCAALLKIPSSLAGRELACPRCRGRLAEVEPG